MNENTEIEYVFTIKITVQKTGYRMDHNSAEKLNENESGLFSPLTLKMVTIFGIALFKVREFVGQPYTPEDRQLHYKYGLWRDYWAGNEIPEVGFETSGILSEGYSIFFIFCNLYVSRDRYCRYRG